MNIVQLNAALATALLCAAAQAQFVKGNEAVQVPANGKKVVTTPSTSGALLGAVCPAQNAACGAAGWKMLETSDGLMECTEIYARASACRESTFGSQKLPRVWIVKLKGSWMHCPAPMADGKCTSVKSLPPTVVQ